MKAGLPVDHPLSPLSPPMHRPQNFTVILTAKWSLAGCVIIVPREMTISKCWKFAAFYLQMKP